MHPIKDFMKSMFPFLRTIQEKKEEKQKLDTRLKDEKDWKSFKSPNSKKGNLKELRRIESTKFTMEMTMSSLGDGLGGKPEKDENGVQLEVDWGEMLGKKDNKKVEDEAFDLELESFINKSI